MGGGGAVMSGWVVVLVVAAIGGAVVATGRLVVEETRRDRARERRLVALGTLLASLEASARAGGGVRESLGRAAAAAGPDLPGAGQIAGALQAGVPLDRALLVWLASSEPLVRSTAAVLTVAHRTGAPLTTAAGAARTLVTDELNLIREIRAAAVTPRTSAVVVGAMPTAAGIVTAAVDPAAARWLLTTPPGLGCLLIGAALEVAATAAVIALVRTALRPADPVVEHLPVACAILGLAAAAGAPTARAVGAAGARSPPPLGPALVSVATAATRGARPAVVAAQLPAALGPAAAPLAAALVDAARGRPLAERMRTATAEAAAARHLNRLVRARRLPVLLLGPLVGLVLPAFILLVVAPLVAAGWGSVGW